jgi:hypothetical protein
MPCTTPAPSDHVQVFTEHNIDTTLAKWGFQFRQWVDAVPHTVRFKHDTKCGRAVVRIRFESFEGLEDDADIDAYEAAFINVYNAYEELHMKFALFIDISHVPALPSLNLILRKLRLTNELLPRTYKNVYGSVIIFQNNFKDGIELLQRYFDPATAKNPRFFTTNTVEAVEWLEKLFQQQK